MGKQEKFIRIRVSCENLAPLLKLEEELQTETLRIAIFANNGSGKTFLSRMLRLTEKDYNPPTESDGKLATDKLLSFDKSKCKFSITITDKENKVVEDFEININQGIQPQKPNTNYIYHCFNEDYVDENIKTLSYQKDGNIVGYILGKANIDVSNEKAKRFQKQIEIEKLIERIKKNISTTVLKKISSITNINRLNEYKLLSFEKITADSALAFTDLKKNYKELLTDYNKIKSVPENLEDIASLPNFDLDVSVLDEIELTLRTSYNIGNFAESLKEKVTSKNDFIEMGLDLMGDTKECPFCEQKFNKAAIALIDSYTNFFKDEEAKTIKQLNNQKSSLRELLKQLQKLSAATNERIIKYNDYVSKYIPSLEDSKLKVVDLRSVKDNLAKIAKQIDDKIGGIGTKIKLEKKIVSEVKEFITGVLSDLEDNNQKIIEINSRKNGIDNENKNVRRELCKIVYNDLLVQEQSDIQLLKDLNQELKGLDLDISQKEEQQRINRKTKVSASIKKILHNFFGDKYSLDEETFRLTIKNRVLNDGQAKNVLSQGEKTVIAFAYYIGDLHLKVEKEDDYKRLFFIIDDPISSMDFNHVYSLSGVIRSLSEIINSDPVRFLIFTHNLDFMRVLNSNKIVNKSYFLKDSSIKEFKNNLTVPYIGHLHDVYKVSKKIIPPSHTTANSIRHIIETLNKFENIEASTESISNYIKDNVSQESKTYTLIHDLSHGGWRSEQAPIHEDDFILVCETLIQLVEKKYKGQIDYCIKLS